MVRLAQSVSMAEFGLALCDDDGAGFEIDRVVVEAAPHMVNVRIRRLMNHSSICGPTEGAVIRWVRREEVLDLIESEARLWPNAAGLKGVSDEREGKKRKQSAPVFGRLALTRFQATISGEHSRQSPLTHDPRHPHCPVPDGGIGGSITRQ